MKHHFIYTLLILAFTLGGCSQKETNEQITTFEKVLGEENSGILTYLVNDFEQDFLKKKYPGLSTEKAYKKLLSEVLEKSNSINDDMMSLDAQKKFQSSHLKLELLGYSDSVWIEGDIIRARILCKTDGKFLGYGSSGLVIRENDNIDSLKHLQKNAYQFNTHGKFMQAIKAIKNGHPFYEDYYQSKYNLGYLANFIIPLKIKNYDLDLNNHITKRIIVLELGYL